MNQKLPVVDLSGKVVLLTGASGGQGVAHARLFDALGAKLILTDVDGPAVEALAAELGNGAIALAHDITSASDWSSVYSVIAKEYGKLDVLINNAGIVTKFSLQDTEENVLRKTIEINLVGAMLGMKLVLPLMKDSGGSIVNIASSAALGGSRNLVAYSASKWGLVGASKSVAVEYGDYGIRVNTVCPGAVDTPMATDDTREGRGFITRIPVPRVGRPDEISNMVAFLASDASSYCTGHEFVVDGGQAI